MSNSIWFGDYRVHIQENIMRHTNYVYLIKDEQRATVFIKGDGTALRFEEGAAVDEKEVVFAEMSNDQLAAFAEALASRGIKTNKDSVAEGKLIATERHLDDMRTIALAPYKGGK